VYTVDELKALTEHERAALLRHLLRLRQADPLANRRDRWRRRMFLTVLTGASAALIPWICFLGFTLPPEYKAADWPLVWLGFDVLLLGSLAATAYLMWRTRQLAVVAAIITGTLLICDAWFDMTLAAGAHDFGITVVTAVCGELPLAALLFLFTGRMLLMTMRLAWAHSGHESPLPKLWRVKLITSAEYLDDPTPVSGRGSRVTK
jgi:hypothetical protein